MGSPDVQRLPDCILKSEMKTSSTPQTNWSHSLSRGTSTPETSLAPESHPGIDAAYASCISFKCPLAKR